MDHLEVFIFFLWFFIDAAVTAFFIWLIIRFVKKKREKRRSRREWKNRKQEKQFQSRRSVYKPKPERWEGSRDLIGGKFTEVWISGYRAVYCFDYYPKKKYPTLNGLELKHRESILKFKEGHYYQAAYLLCDFLKGNFWKNELTEWTLCVIPASTRAKHELRYKAFCEKVSKETGIQNGYDFLWPESDRPDSRIRKEDNTVWNLGCDRIRLMGRKVLLFDDCTTRGVSFKQTADAVRNAGAIMVKGFFLGKSVFIE